MSSPDKNGDMQPPERGGVCCRQCEDPHRAIRFRRTFIVCTTCGNKRCPKATNHELVCSGSNEPGQPGSYYE